MHLRLMEATVVILDRHCDITTELHTDVGNGFKPKDFTLDTEPLCNKNIRNCARPLKTTFQVQVAVLTGDVLQLSAQAAEHPLSIGLKGS